LESTLRVRSTDRKFNTGAEFITTAPVVLKSNLKNRSF